MEAFSVVQISDTGNGGYQKVLGGNLWAKFYAGMSVFVIFVLDFIGIFALVAFDELKFPAAVW